MASVRLLSTGTQLTATWRRMCRERGNQTAFSKATSRITTTIYLQICGKIKHVA